MTGPRNLRMGVALLAVVAATFSSTRSSSDRPASQAPDELSPVVHQVDRASSEITVDGVLDEPAWGGALALELKYEVQPGENVEPPVRTVCLVTYDDRNVYFGFRAYDPDPSRIRARFSDRDKAWDDDWVGVVLDTFNDQRRAYELFSNPLGVQLDAVNDDVEQNYDDSWNAIWKSDGRITSEGYEVEMAVPFNQIRFQSSNGQAQIWGFDAIRSYPRTDRHHIGLFPRERGNNSYLSQTVKLVGMEGADPGKNLEILPTLTASRADTRPSFPDGGLKSGDPSSDLGLTLRWGVTPNVSLNAAVNPDFSQVEADALRLDINEQFALFFPETRPFFLEGADYFNTPLGLVHTRTVADPADALKVTGKQGRQTYGVFTARDDVTNMVFPGAEESSGGSFGVQSTSAAGRYRLDFGRNSTAGGAVTLRRAGEYYNEVASGDTNFRVTPADRISFSLAASETRYSDEMVSAMKADGVLLPAGPIGGGAMMGDYLHTVRNWWIELNHMNVGEDFRSDVGFWPQVDFRHWRLSGARVWWGENGSFHRRMAVGASAISRERQNGDLLEESLETWINMNGPRQSFASVNLTVRNMGYNGVEFEDHIYLHTWLEFQATRDLFLTFHDDYGDWIDYTHTRPARRTLIEPGMSWKLGRHFQVQYSHTYMALDVDGGRLFRVHAPEIRLVQQFSPRAFVRAVVQYVDIERDTDLYVDQVDRRTRDLFAQFLFSYKVNPQTAVYAGYTDNYFGTEDYEPTRVERTFFVKLGYAWVR